MDRARRAVEACAKKSILFRGSEFRHLVEKRLYCGRPYCPRCGEYGSEVHRRRADRLASKLYGVRMSKWVITFPPEDLEFLEGKDDVAEFMYRIASFVMRFYGVPAAEVVVHWRGERTQGIHFEVMFPHDGRPLPRKALRAFPAALAEVLDLQREPVCHFEYVDARLPAALQAKKWWHMVRYACHPSIPPAWVASALASEVRALLDLASGFRTIRGYGAWGDRLIRKTREDLAKLYPMPDELASDRPAPEVVLYDGCPCPVEGCTETLGYIRRCAAIEGGREIAPGVYLHNFRAVEAVPAAAAGSAAS